MEYFSAEGLNQPTLPADEVVDGGRNGTHQDRVIRHELGHMHHRPNRPASHLCSVVLWRTMGDHERSGE